MATTTTEVAIKENEKGELVVAESTLARMKMVGLTVDRTHKQLAAAETDVERIVLQAGLMRYLHDAIDEEFIDCLKLLENNVNGFKTDKTSGYEPEKIKTVAVTALLQGAKLTENEVNIISGECYLTKKYFDRRMREMQGFANYDEGIASPDIVNGKEARFAAWARWTMFGDPMEIKFLNSEDGDYRLVTKYNNSDSPDTLRGKAQSKLWRRVLHKALGYDPLSQLDTPEDDRTVDAVASKRIEETKVEKEHETPKELTDRAEAWTHRKLQACESVGQVKAVKDEALKLIQDNCGGCSEDEVIEIQEYIARLCNHRLTEIKNNRGERSNKD